MQVWTMVCGNTALIASGKPLRPSTTAIRTSPILELVHHPQPELGALGLLDPDAENLLGTVGQDAERDAYRLVARGICKNSL